MFLSIKKCSFFLLFLIPVIFFGQKYDYIGDYDDNDLAIVACKNKFGLINWDKKQVLRLKYTDIKNLKMYNPENSYYLITLKNKKGILDSQLKEIIPAKYKAIELLENNAFLISNNDKVGIFSLTGKEIIPIAYDNIKTLNQNYLVFKNGKTGLFSSLGKEIVPTDYDMITPYRDNDFYSQNSYYQNNYYTTTLNHKKGLIDISKSLIILPVYDSINLLNHNYSVFKNRKVGLIDSLGKETIAPKYDSIKIIPNKYQFYYNDSYYSQYKTLGLWGIIGPQGKEITPASYQKIHIYINNFLVIEKNNKLGLIDILGNEITQTKYQEIKEVNNYFLAKLNDKLGILNETGEEISHFSYDTIKSICYNEYFEVTIGNKKGIFNLKTGKESIPVRYEKINYSCNNSLLITKLNGKYGVIDLSNKTVIPFEYQEIFEYWGLLALKQNDKWGVMNFTGEMLVPCKYDKLKRINNGYFVVSLTNKYGIINAMDQIIIPLKYDNIRSSYCYGNEISATLDNKDGSINLHTKIFKETPHKGSEYDYIVSAPNNIAPSPVPPAPPDPNKIFDGDGDVDEEAQYPEGLEALRNFVYTRLEYPVRALEHRTEGRVMIKFVVEKDGSVSNVSIVRDIGDGCGPEAVRVLKLTSGKWKAAQVNGIPVRSVYRFPVRFRLPTEPQLKPKEN